MEKSIHWINIPVSHTEWLKLKDIKGEMSWRTLILSLLKGDTND